MSNKDNIIYGAILVALIGWLVASIIGKSRESAAYAELNAAHTDARNKSILEFVEKNQLVTNWCEELSSRKRKRLFSIHLERKWLGDAPILFTGHLTNVATESADDYLILVEHSDRWASYDARCRVTPDLQLSLRCGKEQTDQLLRDHPELVSHRRMELAIAATVDRVEYSVSSEYEFGSRESFTGKGVCRDLLFIGS